MKERLIKIALIVSVAFNIAVIAGIIYGGFFANNASGNSSPYRVMNLSPEQRQVVRREYAEMMRQIAEMHDHKSAKWIETVDLLNQSNPDRDAINAKQQEILEIQQSINTLILGKWNELKEFVTPEQAEIFFKVLRQEIASGRVFGKVKADSDR